jgi:hypothetical protein
MERKVSFSTQPVSNSYNSESSVSRVSFHIIRQDGTDIDRSYFLKEDKPGRSNQLGMIQNEILGYDQLKHYGILVPKRKTVTRNGHLCLATLPVEGVSLDKVENIRSFNEGINRLLNQNVEMWLHSSQEISELTNKNLSAVRRVDPLGEALLTSKRIEELIRDNGYNLPCGYVTLFNKVTANLKEQKTNAGGANKDHYFQHGDEILNNFIFNPLDCTVTSIDPSPVLTSRPERALNKMLAGTLLFNFEIDENGIPKDHERAEALTQAVVTANANSARNGYCSSSQTPSILREIVFINFSRINFGIYNKENADFFQKSPTTKFLKLAVNIYQRMAELETV